MALKTQVINILIGAGGTGGHLFPAQQLREILGSDCEILFAGHKLKESPFFNQSRIAYREITSAPLKRGFITALWKGFWQSISILRSFRPDVVVGFGSYHTFPLLLAAVILGKKIVLFEANSTLGKVNRFFAPFAKKIAFQFSSSHLKGATVPFLPWIVSKQQTISSEEARRLFGLDPKKTTLLVFGGSQGAAFLNRRVPLAIHRLNKNIQVIHLTGKGGERPVYQIPSCVKEFEPHMVLAYLAADCAICRSGAGTIAELIQYHLPSLLIPFPYASEDHQTKNGRYLIEKTRGARLLLESEAAPDRLALEIEILLNEIDSFRRSLQNYVLQEPEKINFASLVRQIGEEKS